MPSSSEAKAAYHLRVNVDSFVKHYERPHWAFFATSDLGNLHPLEFARRWISFLRRKRDWMRSFIRCLRSFGKRLTPLSVPNDQWPDPDDLSFVALALATESKVVVTLNPDNFAPAAKHGLRILSPAQAKREFV